MNMTADAIADNSSIGDGTDILQPHPGLAPVHLGLEDRWRGEANGHDSGNEGKGYVIESIELIKWKKSTYLYFHLQWTGRRNC